VQFNLVMPSIARQHLALGTLGNGAHVLQNCKAVLLSGFSRAPADLNNERAWSLGSWNRVTSALIRTRCGTYSENWGCTEGFGLTGSNCVHSLNIKSEATIVRLLEEDQNARAMQVREPKRNPTADDTWGMAAVYFVADA
jgi:hypothetical protein